MRLALICWISQFIFYKTALCSIRAAVDDVNHALMMCFISRINEDYGERKLSSLLLLEFEDDENNYLKT